MSETIHHSSGGGEAGDTFCAKSCCSEWRDEVRITNLVPFTEETMPVPKALLPSSSTERKDIPLCRGVLDYFPLALAEVARVSKAGNDQHNPGQPLHWAREKSTDHADCIARHLIERGTPDSDGMRHTAKLAWRALALLQTELEEGP